jgi:type II secretory pathway component PulF
MREYRYTARDQQGIALEGVVSASSEEAAVARLTGKGIWPSSIQAETAVQVTSIWERKSVPLQVDDRIDLYTRLAMLLDTGVTLLEGLGWLEEEEPSPAVATAVQRLRLKVEEGGSVAEGLEGSVPPVEQKVVGAYEQGGALAGGLQDLATRLARQRSWRQSVTDALRYPAIVGGFLFMGFSVVALVIAPKYGALFSAAGITLPPTTALLMAVSAVIQDHLIGTSIGGTLIGIGIGMVIRSPRFQQEYDRWLVDGPIIGPVMVGLAVSRWADTLGALIAAGIPIRDAFSMAIGALGNLSLEADLAVCGEKLEGGQTLSMALAGERRLPKLLIRMIRLAEKTGSLDTTLSDAARWYGESTARRVKRSAAYIEPGLIVLAAGVTLFLALSVFTPLWELSTLTRR